MAHGTAANEYGTIAIYDGSDYVFAGDISTDNNALAVKTDPQGGTGAGWARTFGAGSTTEHLRGGVFTAGPLYTLVGTTTACAPSPTTAMGIQLDALGSYTPTGWSTCYTCAADTAATTVANDVKPLSIAPDNGKFVVVGSMLGSVGACITNGAADALLFRITSAGAIDPGFGGVTYDDGTVHAQQVFYAVAVDTLEGGGGQNYYVVGSDQNAGFVAGGMGEFVMMVDRMGAAVPLWIKAIDSANIDIAYDVAFDPNHNPGHGQVVVVGTSNVGGGSFVMTVNVLKGGSVTGVPVFGGTSVWSDTISSPAGDAKAFAVTLADDGNYVVAGYGTFAAPFGKQIYVVKLDATNGNVLWSRHYGKTGDEMMDVMGGSSIVNTANGFIVTGYTNSIGAGGNDLYTVSIDDNGDIADCTDDTNAGAASAVGLGLSTEVMVGTSRALQNTAWLPAQAAVASTRTQECPFESICNDNVDNDGDGLIDCADFVDCPAATACNDANACTSGETCSAGHACTATRTETATQACCTDTIDNDADTFTDCADADCNTVNCGTGGHPTWPAGWCATPACSCHLTQANEATCNDGLDNDCDTLVDCADNNCNNLVCNDPAHPEWLNPQCGNPGACACVPGVEAGHCADGKDNDCDTFTDCADVADCAADPACIVVPGGPTTGGRIYSAPAFDLLGIAALMALAVLVVIIVMYRRD